MPEGHFGAKLLVTTLTNRTCPLVRYELTDIVSVTTAPCPCGLPFARICSIEGRREEMLQFAKRGGGVIAVQAGRLRSTLLATEGVRQFQFVRAPDGLDLIVAIDPTFDSQAIYREAELAMHQVLDGLGAAPVDVRARVVETIGRSGTGAKEKLVGMQGGA